MDKRIMDQIVDIRKDVSLHHKAVLNWYTDNGKVHLEEDFFIRQFFKSDYEENISYEWFSKPGGDLMCWVEYKGFIFFALISPIKILENLIKINPSLD